MGKSHIEFAESLRNILKEDKKTEETRRRDDLRQIEEEKWRSKIKEVFDDEVDELILERIINSMTLQESMNHIHLHDLKEVWNKNDEDGDDN